MDQKKQIVQGFKASAVVAGLKKGDALDMALIVSDREAAAAGIFTTNKVKAAPVILSERHVENGKARAIVVNAGNANACTGDSGLNDARRTAELVGQRLGISPEDILIASTGVIGEQLDMHLIAGAIPRLTKALAPDAVPLAAQAMMTTDSFPKISRFEGKAGKHSYRIMGIAKGAGMIMPNMATMLCFILSDISINSDDLKRALLSSVKTTFNRISVDGDTSTNDTVLAMANGLAGNGDLRGEDYDIFTEGLRNVMWDLARMIVRDGDGATKLVNVEVKNAFSPSDALIAARTVANSSLVKTALYGQDPNWGRIMAALGRAEIEMREDRVDIWIDDIRIVVGGLGRGAEAEKLAAEIMTRNEFALTVDLHEGGYHDRMLTCDLTHEYVTINADYRT